MDDTDLERLTQDVMALPLYRFLGLELVSSCAGRARMRLPVTGAAMGLGHFNGGIMPTLLDATCFFAVLPMLEEVEQCSTTDTSSALLRPIQEGDTIESTSEVIQRGRTRAFIRATATVDDRVVAYGHVTKAILRPDGGRWS